jgi:hypothetical protein
MERLFQLQDEEKAPFLKRKDRFVDSFRNGTTPISFHG